MIGRLLILIFLHLVFAGHMALAEGADWTEKKLGKVILKADKAARYKNWDKAIKYGEKMLLGTQALDQKSDARYINQLKNLNKYYDKAGRLAEVSPRVIEAYTLSKKYLGQKHVTTNISRYLYYKLLLSEKSYSKAIFLIHESISILGDSKKDSFKHLRYLEQLASLYGITKQLEKEEKTLLLLLNINKTIFGYNDDDNRDIILILAENYCRRGKIKKFEKLVIAYNLKYFCK